MCKAYFLLSLFKKFSFAQILVTNPNTKAFCAINIQHESSQLKIYFEPLQSKFTIFLELKRSKVILYVKIRYCDTYEIVGMRMAHR